MLEYSAVGDKPVMLTGLAGLDKYRFNYGRVIQNQWVERNTLFLNVVGS